MQNLINTKSNQIINQNIIHNAIKMIQDDISIKLIAKSTGLSIDDVARIKVELKYNLVKYTNI